MTKADVSNADLIARTQKRLDEITETMREIVAELCDAIAARDDAIAAKDEIIAAQREALTASDRALTEARMATINHMDEARRRAFAALFPTDTKSAADD